MNIDFRESVSPSKRKKGQDAPNIIKNNWNAKQSKNTNTKMKQLMDTCAKTKAVSNLRDKVKKEMKKQKV